MLNLLREILVRFVKPPVLVDVSCTYLLNVEYDNVANQLEDEELLIGHEINDSIASDLEGGNLTANQRDNLNWPWLGILYMPISNIIWSY